MSPSQYLANLKAVGINVPVEIEEALRQQESDFAVTREALLVSVEQTGALQTTVARLGQELNEMTIRHEVAVKMARQRTITQGDIAVRTGIRMKELQQMLVEGGLRPKVEDRPYNGEELRLEEIVCIINRLKKGA